MTGGADSKRPRLLFIASLGRSGSTLLDLLLGANPRIVGLGEVWKTLRLAADEQHRCTCGEPGLECPVWGEVLARRRADPNLPMGESYRLLIERVGRAHGSEVVIADSSKDLVVLREVTDILERQFKVLFLLKDVRAYAASLADVGRTPGSTIVADTLRRSNFLRALQWWVRNRAFADYLRESGLAFMQVGYEEICFRPELMLQKICEFVDVPYDPAMLAPTSSKSHILRGNPMRWDPARRRAIVYDNRWFYRPRVQVLTAALPFVFSWNTENVYRNIREAALRPTREIRPTG